MSKEKINLVKAKANLESAIKQAVKNYRATLDMKGGAEGVCRLTDDLLRSRNMKVTIERMQPDIVNTMIRECVLIGLHTIAVRAAEYKIGESDGSKIIGVEG